MAHLSLPVRLRHGLFAAVWLSACKEICCVRRTILTSSKLSLARAQQNAWLLLCVLAGFQCIAVQAAESTTPAERQVKAAYLQKFASFVEWPEGTFMRADSPLVIGVIGADALADELERSTTGQSVGNRAVSMRKLRRGDSLAGLHILFIGQMEKAALTEVLNASRSQPLLTVTESEEGHALGSMINFVVIDDKLRFAVALKPVGFSRLKISARMLSAAYKVEAGAS